MNKNRNLLPYAKTQCRQIRKRIEKLAQFHASPFINKVLPSKTNKNLINPTPFLKLMCLKESTGELSAS